MKSERNKTIIYKDLESQMLYEKVITEFSCVENSINKTIHNDCIYILSKIPSGSIDLIVTDPPYNLDKIYAGNKFSSQDNINYEKWLEKRIQECKRVLKDTGTIYICCDWKSSTQVYNVMSKYFTLKNRITREREKGRGAASNRKNNIEDIYFGVKNDKIYTFNLNDVKVKKSVVAPYKNQDGEAKDRFVENGQNYRMTCPSNIRTDITIPFWSMPENTEHPTQKPEKVIAKLIIASSNRGDIVLDPFLGSGTTSVVSKKLGRKYIGIEQEKEYCVIAEHRLTMADKDISIQGIENGVFLERNTMSSERKNIGTKKRILLPIDNHLFSNSL